MPVVVSPASPSLARLFPLGRVLTTDASRTTANGHTVAFLLKALDLSYETKYLDFAKGEQKSDAYLSRCANGRIPA